MAMTKDEVRSLQRALNRFSHRLLRGVAPLRVDGVYGQHTRARIRLTKHYLGYLHGPKSPLNPKPTLDFRKRLHHPKNPLFSTVRRVARGMKRRSRQRREWKRHQEIANVTHGVTHYDGRPVAAWIVPYLEWARHTGHNGRRWHGILVSGWRDPIYSESLCYHMCGRPSCPGLCAGRSSNHSGQVKPAGAVDVTDYWTFGQLMPYCPHTPHLVNHLARDRVHFSVSGG